VTLVSIQLALSQTPVYTARPWIRGYCIMWCACLLVLIAPTHWDGQAELTWLAGYRTIQYTQELSPIAVLIWLSIE